MNTRLHSATSEGGRANVSELAFEMQPAAEMQPPTADPFVEPLSLLSSQLDEITSLILQLERSHSEEMEKAAVQLRDQITADLQNQHRGQFETGIQALREEFEERMRSTTAQWEVERQSLLNEIEHLRHHNVSAPVRQAEVAQTE